MKTISRTFWFFPQRMPFFIGCALGITLSLIILPLLEERCLFVRNPSDTSESLDIVDDYEPVLNVKGKPKKNLVKQDKSMIVRPRYYSTELGIRDKLFIGIITTPNTILTFGSSLNKTVWKHANKVVFFLEGAESQNIDVPLHSVVSFPQKKSVLIPFDMLEHISDNYLADYDFFFFAKDNTHIRGKKLMELVNHISISQSVHTGERMHMDSLYCSLDAGILLSNNILKKTVENLDWCIQHTFSDNHSDNFGRCILHGTSLPCSFKIQGLNFISHQISKHSNLQSFLEKSSWAQYLKNTATLYSVSNQEEHYLIHHYFSRQELLDNQRKLLLLQDQISNISTLLPTGTNKVTWPIGLEPPFKPHNRFDVIRWTYFNESHNLLPDEMTVLSELRGLCKTEIHDIIKSSVGWIRDKYHDKYIYQKLVNGYKKFDPTRGTEYILDLVFLEDETGKEILKRINAVRPLNEVEIVPVPFVTEHTRIILLLIIKSDEKKGARMFLEDYAKSCLDKKDSTVLLLVFLYGPKDPGKEDKDDVFGSLKNLINMYTNKYRSSRAKIAWLSVRTIGKQPPNYAIIDLISRKLTSDSLILLCQTNMEIHPEYLNRVRMNTIIKTQVFFPIPFVQYHPAVAYRHSTFPDVVELKKDLGHFDAFDYSHCSFYLSDYLNARKNFGGAIPAIKIDHDLKSEALYDLNFSIHDILLKSHLHVMRAVEPHLRMKFFISSCNLQFSSVTYHECVLRRANNLGTKSQLASVVLSHAELENASKSEVNVDL